MARQLPRFATDRVAHFARNRGDGNGEARQSRVGDKGQPGWPGQVHQPLVRRDYNGDSVSDSDYIPSLTSRPTISKVFDV
jgi:hypothetical protein